VAELKAPLIVVLGHDECGAVKAAMAGKPLTGNLGKLIDEVHVGRESNLPAAIRANAVYHAGELTRKSPLIEEFVESKRVQIAAGIYSLATGKVTWLAGRVDGKGRQDQ
jgi:carbonic anhydrase